MDPAAENTEAVTHLQYVLLEVQPQTVNKTEKNSFLQLCESTLDLNKVAPWFKSGFCHIHLIFGVSQKAKHSHNIQKTSDL